MKTIQSFMRRHPLLSIILMFSLISNVYYCSVSNYCKYDFTGSVLPLVSWFDLFIYCRARMETGLQ